MADYCKLWRYAPAYAPTIAHLYPMATITNNTTAHQFELPLDGAALAILGYSQQGNTYQLLHTDVPAAYRGQGKAEVLVEGALKLIKAQGGQIIPTCAYIQVYLRRQPQWQALVQQAS